MGCLIKAALLFTFKRGKRKDRFILFPRAFLQSEMQTVSFRIWTRVTISTFKDNNNWPPKSSSGLMFIQKEQAFQNPTSAYLLLFTNISCNSFCSYKQKRVGLCLKSKHSSTPGIALNCITLFSPQNALKYFPDLIWRIAVLKSLMFTQMSQITSTCLNSISYNEHLPKKHATNL